MKRLLLSIVALLVSAYTFGQLSLGVRGGYGLYGINFEPPSLNGNQEKLYEPNFGFLAIFNDKNNAGIQLEVNYAVKGWKEIDKDIDSMQYKREITYLEIPVMTHFELGRSWFRIYGLLGPYIAFKQKEKTTIQNYETIIANNKYDMYNQKIRDLDFGNKIGVGFRINVGTYLSILADVRYDMQIAGGQNIFKKQPNKIQASRLTELSCSAGIVFNLLPQQVEKEKEYYVPKVGIEESNY